MKQTKDLDDLFTEAIANLDKVTATEVTSAYIEQQREQKIYPDAKMERDAIGLKSYTRNQWRRITELVDELLSHV